MKCIKKMLISVGVILLMPHVQLHATGVVRVLNELNGYPMRWDLTSAPDTQSFKDRWIAAGPGTSSKESLTTPFVVLGKVVLYWIASDQTTKAYKSRIDIDSAKDGTWIFICRNKGVRSLHSGTTLDEQALKWYVYTE